VTVACPYCRAPIEEPEGQAIICAGCGTPHHADCYQENGGCTVFGCSAAPADEPKLSLSNMELGSAQPAQVTHAAAQLAAPPPPLAGMTKETSGTAVPYGNAGSVLFRAQPVARTVSAPVSVDWVPHPNAKDRRTFILLGVLLGMLGAHNFYAGYKSKAFAQLAISILSLGFASPMSWVWALIDVLTIEEDSTGIKFKN
jgi:TM2 domain-containing membrane protein YozV